MFSGFIAQVRVEQNRLPEFARKLTPAVASAMRNGMLNYLVVAAGNTPVDTGFMKANKSFVWPSAGYGGNPVGYIGWNAEYSPFVHNGTYRMQAQPWARQAADEIRNDYSRAVAAAVMEGLS